MNDPISGEFERCEILVPKRHGEGHNGFPFQAAVKKQGDHVVVSPVPERVPTPVLPFGVEFYAESVPSDTYLWVDHKLTASDTYVTKLTPVNVLEGGADE
jgi:hypothetical protein